MHRPDRANSKMKAAASESLTRAAADRMDREDPLAAFRARFVDMDDGALYMDGNSLGRQPRETRALVSRALDAWRDEMILAWRDWIHVPRRIGDLIAESVLEAKPGEVIVGDSTSINL